jgi:hypothetical protein
VSARRALLVALLLLAAVPARAQEWRDVGTAEGRFTLSVPGAPAISTQTYDHGGVGTRWTVNAAADEAYVAEVTLLPPSLAGDLSAAELLAAAQSGAVGTGTLLRERDVALGPYPGRAFDVRTADGFIAQVRTYWVRPRLYQIIAVTSPAKAILPTSARFLDSFRVLSP